MFRDRIALLTLLSCLLLISLPFALAAAWSPPDKEFLGSFYNAQDVMVYLSAMRAGARGEWLRTLPFTTEPHAPTLYYPFYTLLGHLAPPDLLTFHSARLVVVVCMAFALWLLIAEMLPTPLERRIAFILALLGMGFGWLVTLSGLSKVIRSTDIFAPTSSLLGAALLNPHFPLGVALQFVTLTFYLRARRTPYRAGTLFAGALACLVMGWVLPYQVVVVGAILCADVVWESLRQHRWWTASARHAFWILLPSSTVFIYYLSLNYFMPFWSELIRQWPVLEHIFSPLDFVSGYGLLLIMALIGARFLLRQHERTAGERLLLAWLPTNALLIVAPLDFADRTSLGFSAALAMLSAIAFARALPAWNRLSCVRISLIHRYPNLRSSFPLILLLIVMPSVLLLDLSLVLLARGENELPYYLSSDDAVTINWLRQHASTHDIVLAAPAISNLIPGLTDARVYSGHTHETFQTARKNADVKNFFSADTLDTSRCAFLRAQGITFVYARPFEAIASDGRGAAYLEPVMQNAQVTLYRVVEHGK